jgi:hypothetical protein
MASSLVRVNCAHFRAKHTGQETSRTIERDTDRANFCGADEPVKYGLMDKVLVSRSQVGGCFFVSIVLGNRPEKSGKGRKLTEPA